MQDSEPPLFDTLRQLVLRLLPILLLALLAVAHAYHLQLEASPAAVFPYLGKFGEVNRTFAPAACAWRRSGCRIGQFC
jgi:hypothetical protein